MSPRGLILAVTTLLAVHTLSAQQGGMASDSLNSLETSFVIRDLFHQKSSLQSTDVTANEYLIRGLFSVYGGIFRAEFHQSDFELRNSNARSTFDFSFAGKVRGFSLGYCRGIGAVDIEVGLDALDEHQHLSLYGSGFIGMRFPSAYVENIRIGIRRSTLGQSIHLAYLDSELPLSHDLGQTAVEGMVNMSLFPKNTLLIRYSRARSTPQGAREVFSADDHSNSTSWSAIASQEIASWDAQLSYDNSSIESNWNFYRDASSFGDATVSAASTWGVELMLRHNDREPDDANLAAEYRKADGTLTGNLQSWPFYGVLQSVIANRINFRLFGSLQYWLVRTSKLWRIGDVSIRPALAYYDVKPDATIQTWQPLLLVFGVSQSSNNSLDVIHAGLGQFELTCGIQTSWFGIELSGTQFFPVFQKHRAEGTASSAPSTPADNGGTTKTDGGRWVRVTLKRVL